MDIYDEIEYDELRGPEAPSTIPLDVQDDQDMIDGSDEDNVVRGIMPGKSEEVRQAASSIL
jgi:hypothetical protein